LQAPRLLSEALAYFMQDLFGEELRSAADDELLGRPMATRAVLFNRSRATTDRP
jgi:hypothetical protein